MCIRDRPIDIIRGAEFTIKRVDGGVFDLTALTFKLLGNTAATGAAVEIMPLLAGEDGLADPVMLDASGYYGGTFSYGLTPAPYTGQSTLLLHDFDEYKITLLWILHLWT